MKRFYLCLAISTAAVLLFGQAFSSLSGTVTDPTGAVVPGATIILENLERGVKRETTSDAAGRYSFPQIQPDTYKLTAKAQGFADVVVSDVRLLVNTPASVNIQFEKVGAVAETVSVSAEAIQVNTTDATLGNAIGTNAITQLPFEARNVVGLLALQPGVSYLGDTTDSRNGAVNGGKSDQANVTLDGVDVNDQQNRYAFTSVLRVTLDSVQEFRVTTANANADQGRSSGAQVALVTKNGTNEIHGSLYEYHRNTATTANDFFNNASGVERAKLLRNVFGASAGGPFRKNRFFYFFNYEGRRDRKDTNVVRTIPSAELRQGIVQYRRADGSVGTLTPQEIKTRVDPAGIGPNLEALKIFQSYPMPNDYTVGDGLNRVGYRFKAPTPLRQNTYIARLDFVVDSANKHNLFWRGNLQNDHSQGVPQFPGDPPRSVLLDNSKGIAVGYNAVLKANLISTFRYGLTRQGVETTGIQNASAVSFRGLDDRYALTRGLARIAPVHQVGEDMVWTRGGHNVQFGVQARWIRNSRVDFTNSFHFGSTNSSWLKGSGVDLQTNVPDLNRTFRVAYNDAMMALLGIVSQVNSRFNYNVQGDAQPVGAPVRRKFAGEEYEFYVQDTWRVSRALTVTAGLRYSLMPPIYEANGQQISAVPSLGEWFNLRGRLAQEGKSQAEAGRIKYVVANGPEGRSLYPYAKKNFAPRLSLAYSPQPSDGWRKFLFGGPGQTSIRAGWGMFYDVMGQGVINTFDAAALGLSTALTNPSGQLTPVTAPRFTGIYTIPSALIAAAPKGGFPQEAPDRFAITSSFDDALKPPYNMNMNFTIGREFRGGILVQGSYVGRLSRRSLAQRDLSMPTDLKDPASGVTYYDAAKQMVGLMKAKTPTAQVAKIPYWENLWPGLAGGGKTSTQVVYDLFRLYAPDYSAVQADIDHYCDPACSKLGPDAMFNKQYSALSAWSSIAGGNYHAMQWTLRKRFSQGVQFDLSYVWSKSVDLASDAERVGAFSGGFNYGFIFNSWAPWQRKGVSDYDTTQSWNAMWVVELPFGRKKRWGSNMNGALDALLGGWQITGIWRQTTELPASVNNGRNWPTNWNLPGFASQTGIVPAPKKTKNAPAVSGQGGPNVFSDPKPALEAYDFTLPGESGQRNGIRCDGFFTVDFGLGKRFVMPYRESHSLQFRWETFNAGNNVRFDSRSVSLDLGNSGTFGKYSGLLTNPRVMQFSLRYEF